LLIYSEYKKTVTQIMERPFTLNIWGGGVRFHNKGSL
jgi:hypothetical protein